MFFRVMISILIFLVNIYGAGIEGKFYHTALKFYKSKDYKHAYKILNRDLFKNLNNANWQYYLGRSAYELGRYNEAISAFERVSMLKPTSIRAKLEMARAYFKIKRYDKSKKIFQEILKKEIPPQVRKNIKKYLIAIEKSKKRNFLNATAIVGINYDSNINNSSIYDSYHIPFYKIDTTNKTPHIKELAHQEILMLNDIYDIGDIGGYAIKNSATLFLKTMAKHADKNVFYYSYSPSLLYKTSRYLIELALGYDRMFYGSNPYLHSFFITPSFKYNFSKSFSTKTSFKFQEKRYENSSRGVRDSNYYEVKLSFSKKINSKISILPSIAFERDRKVNSTLTNINLDATLFALSGQYTISSDKSIGAKILYKNIDYKELDPTFLNKREDRYYNTSINFGKKFYKKYLFQTSIGYINNHSNEQPYSYHKYYLNMNIIRRF